MLKIDKETRKDRLRKVRLWIEKGLIHPESGDFRYLRYSKEEERVLAWLHSPQPTEPVLIELKGKTLPAVKFALDDGIFALYVMECGGSSTQLEDTMSFAGLYDPKTLRLYTSGAQTVLSDALPFAVPESQKNAFLESAVEAFLTAVREMEGSPDVLDGACREMWDLFKRTYAAVVHEAYVSGGSVRDIFSMYTMPFLEELAPEWTREFAAAYLGNENRVACEFLDSLEDKVFQLGACMWNWLEGYWKHVMRHKQHPAHRLHEIALACDATNEEFVQLDLANPKDQTTGSVAVPKCCLPDGGFGAFDTRTWPDAVRSELKAIYPESFGCFHVSDIMSVRELFSGRLLYKASPSTQVCENAWDTMEAERRLMQTGMLYT